MEQNSPNANYVEQMATNIFYLDILSPLRLTYQTCLKLVFRIFHKRSRSPIKSFLNPFLLNDSSITFNELNARDEFI